LKQDDFGAFADAASHLLPVSPFKDSNHADPVANLKNYNIVSFLF